MKYLVFIFSVYLALLTVLPCQDDLDVSKKTAQVSSITTPSKDTSHRGEELCPPFCSCACCSVSRDFIANTEQSIMIDYVAIAFSKFRVPAISETFIEIYQPPQIV